MRLVDADALYEKVDDHVTSVSVCATVQQAIGQTDFKWRCLEDIHNAPTIEAIPVEWLEAQISPCGDNLKDGVRGIFNATIREMIYRWRQEQGARE